MAPTDPFYLHNGQSYVSPYLNIPPQQTQHTQQTQQTLTPSTTPETTPEPPGVPQIDPIEEYKGVEILDENEIRAFVDDDGDEDETPEQRYESDDLEDYLGDPSPPLKSDDLLLVPEDMHPLIRFTKNIEIEGHLEWLFENSVGNQFESKRVEEIGSYISKLEGENEHMMSLQNVDLYVSNLEAENRRLTKRNGGLLCFYRQCEAREQHLHKSFRFTANAPSRQAAGRAAPAQPMGSDQQMNDLTGFLSTMNVSDARVQRNEANMWGAFQMREQRLAPERWRQFRNRILR